MATSRKHSTDYEGIGTERKAYVINPGSDFNNIFLYFCFKGIAHEGPLPFYFDNDALYIVSSAPSTLTGIKGKFSDLNLIDNKLELHKTYFFSVEGQIFTINRLK
jgi:hypothetical protein